MRYRSLVRSAQAKSRIQPAKLVVENLPNAYHIRLMKIRDLPVMSYRGVRNWPPEWVCQQSGPRMRGEVGRLKDAFVDVRNNTRCFLFMEHNGYGYIATIMFDDGLFPPLFAAVLKRHLGKSIKEIGDLDIADEFRSPSDCRYPS